MNEKLVPLSGDLIQSIRSAFRMAYARSDYGDHRVAYGIAERAFEDALAKGGEPVSFAPAIKLSSHNVAVDQNYFWDLNMNLAPNGKVQLLGRGGLPFYGKPSQAPNFAIAWAGLPKLPPDFKPENFK